jgi:nucleoside-diphosphate-sugar epimerase
VRFTVLGSAGFIGSHLVSYLQEQGIECIAVDRGRVSSEHDLGHVVNCVGLTADFRNRPIETIEAHINFVCEFLSKSRFHSFLYLSSTRVYRHAKVADENALLPVDPRDPEDLYNLSKLTGESLCLNMNNPKVRVARLSNVYGIDIRSENFLTSIIRSAVQAGEVNIRNGPLAQKDYVSIADVVRLIPQISQCGKCRLYNVASGYNVDNASLTKILQYKTGCKVTFSDSPAPAIFPQISIRKITEEFGFQAARVEEEFADLIQAFQSALN